jgi:hypothetical protein
VETLSEQSDKKSYYILKIRTTLALEGLLLTSSKEKSCDEAASCDVTIYKGNSSLSDKMETKVN